MKTQKKILSIAVWSLAVVSPLQGMAKELAGLIYPSSNMATSFLVGAVTNCSGAIVKSSLFNDKEFFFLACLASEALIAK